MNKQLHNLSHFSRLVGLICIRRTVCALAQQHEMESSDTCALSKQVALERFRNS